VKARDLHRVLDRLGAGREKDRLLGCCARGERIQSLRECDVTLVRRHLEAGVRELLDLLGEGGLHARMHMTRIEHGDAARKVDITAALDIPQLGVLRVIGVDPKEVGDATRHGIGTAAMQFVVGGHET
jgi:hypothetical protein